MFRKITANKIPLIISYSLFQKNYTSINNNLTTILSFYTEIQLSRTNYFELKNI